MNAIFTKKICVAVAAGLLAAAFAGCGTSGIKTPEINTTITPEAQAYGEIIAASAGRLNPVYFEFDKSRLDANASVAVGFNADYLKSNALNVLIEGNAHEYGGSDYNFALGLRRANVVKDALVAAGVSAARMQVVSNGNANPVCEVDNTPRCNAVNRRVEFVVLP